MSEKLFEQAMEIIKEHANKYLKKYKEYIFEQDTEDKQFEKMISYFVEISFATAVLQDMEYETYDEDNEEQYKTIIELSKKEGFNIVEYIFDKFHSGVTLSDINDSSLYEIIDYDWEDVLEYI